MKVLQPSEQPLDFPAATVPLQETTILRLGPFLSIRGEHFDAPSLFQSGIKGITVVGLVADQTFWKLIGKSKEFHSGWHEAHWVPACLALSAPWGAGRRGARCSHCSLVMSITTSCWMRMKKSRGTLCSCHILIMRWLLAPAGSPFFPLAAPLRDKKPTSRKFWKWGIWCLAMPFLCIVSALCSMVIKSKTFIYYIVNKYFYINKIIFWINIVFSVVFNNSAVHSICI